jgi:hypothetical protein
MVSVRKRMTIAADFVGVGYVTEEETLQLRKRVSCRRLMYVFQFRPRPPRLSEQARDGGQAETEKIIQQIL